jgi:hypothetical protein
MIDLYRTGMYLRKPGGNVEVPVEQKAAGMEWALLNIGGDVGRDPTVWDHQRKLYRQADVPIGPWMHVRSMDDLTFLLGVAVDWQADIIGPNVEDVVDDKLSLQEIGGYLLDFWVNPYGKPVHMATLPWLQNGQGWQYVAFAYIALELFPLETPLYLAEYEACIQHAFNEGCKKVTLLYSTTSPRSTYPPDIAHCLYTADNVTNWPDWKDTVPQLPPKPKEDPPVPPNPPSLTIKQFPYTGPLVVGDTNRDTCKGLKRGLIRGGYMALALGSETDDFGPELEAALKKLQRDKNIKPASGKYGRDSWLAMRSLHVPAESPNAGKYAMDAKALAYVKLDTLKMCYPHPKDALSEICQGPHETDGLYGNWAIDFCAPGGTKVLAVERATIRKLSGRSPSQGWYGPGVFGYSIHYETPEGYRYFSTHYGSRSKLTVGQVVEVGQVLGTVGHWPGDPSRSHTHLGVTSPFGEADARKHITAVSEAVHLVA